jgi:DNA-binding NarL/FixJ family response regulator
VQILKAGALGYLLKDSADVDLLHAAAAVSEGKSFFSPAIGRLMLDDSVRQLADKGVTDCTLSVAGSSAEQCSVADTCLAGLMGRVCFLRNSCPGPIADGRRSL